MSKPSRQRQWQLDQKEKGNCQICAKPSQGRAQCDACAKRQAGITCRRPLKSAWRQVDWDQPIDVIARRFGVSTGAAYYQRKKHKPAMARRQRGARIIRMKAMLIQCAESLDAIESAMVANPAQLGATLTEAQDKLAKFIREEFGE